MLCVIQTAFVQMREHVYGGGGGCASTHERELYFVGQREYICYTSAMCPRKHVTRTTDMMFQKSQCSFFEDPLYNLEVKSTVYCVHAKSYRPQFLRKQ